MKTKPVQLLIGGMILIFALLGVARAAEAPNYRGKVILIVDQTLNADTDISNKLVRLTGDLVGDGWRVLRHDVERGLDPATQNAAWQKQVRSVRAVIKADYDASPSEVKSVLLIGHVAVPYAGQDHAIVGGHREWGGAHAADPFYGELTTSYGGGSVSSGWSDINTDNFGFPNTTGDGRFDQSELPSAMEVAVGRVDFYNMPAFGLSGESATQTELRLISQYFEKNHDFRLGNFLVQRRAILAGKEDFDAVTSCSKVSQFDSIFGSANVTKNCDCECIHWFPSVDGAGEDYLFGWTLGPSGMTYSEGIGATHPNDWPDYCAVDSNGVDPNEAGDDNAWVTRDSRVVFLTMFGSYFGEYDYPNNFMRAALANRYDPANGKHGYGLTAYWGGALNSTSLATLTKMALGTPVGEAIQYGSAGDFDSSANYGFLGDPTLRWHVVRPVTGLVGSQTTTTATLSWNHSPDATGYYVVRAPTSSGPWTYVATLGYVNSYVATRPTTGDPDNFYMVRASKTETTLVGNYINKSAGATLRLPGFATPYYQIIANPVSQKVRLGDPASFSVEAAGIATTGNEKLTYQWYKNGVAIPATDPQIKGSTTNAIVISTVASSDAASYHVVVSLSPAQKRTSPAVTLSINTPPVAVNDVFTVVRNTPTTLNFLANDSDVDDPVANLKVSFSPLLINILNSSFYGVGTFVQNGQNVQFTPARTFLGTLNDYYWIEDGAGASGAEFTLNVVAHFPNQNPTISTIGNQSISALGSVNIPFTVGDADYTQPGDLVVSASCSGSLLDAPNLIVTGSGGNRVLNLKAGARIGTETVTISVEDEDGGVAVRTFVATVIPLQVATMYPIGFSGNNFQFTLHGPSSVSMEVKKSDDLITWTSLGTVTIGANNSYSFTDYNVGSVTKRYYSAFRNGYGCAVNPIGFVRKTIPAPSCPNMPVVAHLGNPLNRVQGNDIFSIVGVNDGRRAYSQWDASLQNWVYIHNGSFTPGFGLAIENSDHNNGVNTIFVGEILLGVQAVTLVPGFSLVSSRIPQVLSLDQLGLPAALDDVIQFFNPGTQQYQIATFDGAQWLDNTTGLPSAIAISPGDAFFFYNDGNTAKTWTQNVVVCP